MASIGLLTVVAIDRYISICRPDIGMNILVVQEFHRLLVKVCFFVTKLYFLHAGVLVGQKMTTHSYTLLIMAAWLNAVFWSAMPIVGWAGYAPDPTGATCTINWRNNDA